LALALSWRRRIEDHFVSEGEKYLAASIVCCGAAIMGGAISLDMRADRRHYFRHSMHSNTKA
jgi:hypothetical protein